MTTRPAEGRAPLGATPWLLRRVNQRYRDAMREALTAAGFGDLPQPGYWAIGGIGAGALDATDLVGQMGISKQAVSKLVDSLVDAGYLERKANAADRRRTNLALTKRGRQAAAVIAAAVAKTESIMARELGSGGLEEFRRLLGLIG
jgi:DNA-binding MarR family transcriptional regulator